MTIFKYFSFVFFDIKYLYIQLYHSQDAYHYLWNVIMLCVSQWTIYPYFSFKQPQK